MSVRKPWTVFMWVGFLSSRPRVWHGAEPRAAMVGRADCRVYCQKRQERVADAARQPACADGVAGARRARWASSQPRLLGRAESGHLGTIWPLAAKVRREVRAPAHPAA